MLTSSWAGNMTYNLHNEGKVLAVKAGKGLHCK